MSIYKRSSYIIAICIMLNACQTYRGPESVEAKMKRYKAQNAFYYSPPKIVQSSRLIRPSHKRSLASQKTADLSAESKEIKDISLRNIYFLTLLSQYKSLTSYLSKASPEIQSCPAFHNSFLENKGKISKWFQDESKNNPGLLGQKKFEIDRSVEGKAIDEVKAIYPEYAINLDDEDLQPTFYEYLVFTQENPDKKSTLREVYEHSLSQYSKKIYQELLYLCENGTSSNFYIFQNFASIAKSQNLQNKTDVYFKLNLIVNMVLIQTIPPKKTLTSFNPFEKEVLDRISGDWIVGYIEDLLDLRTR